MMVERETKNMRWMPTRLMRNVEKKKTGIAATAPNAYIPLTERNPNCSCRKMEKKAEFAELPNQAPNMIAIYNQKCLSKPPVWNRGIRHSGGDKTPQHRVRRRSFDDTGDLKDKGGEDKTNAPHENSHSRRGETYGLKKKGQVGHNHSIGRIEKEISEAKGPYAVHVSGSLTAAELVTDFSGSYRLVEINAQGNTHLHKEVPSA